jgi:hypothetical protein
MNSTEQLRSMYDEVVGLLNAGRVGEAKVALNNGFKSLPGEMQGELLTRMILKGIAQKAERENAVEAVQRRGMEMLDEMDGEDAN